MSGSKSFRNLCEKFMAPANNHGHPWQKRQSDSDLIADVEDRRS
jgi:hypothetical protein